MTKRFTLQPMIEAAGCALFGFYILKLCLTNEFLFYLTPRMKPWLIFTACVMFAWALSAAKTAFEADHYHVNLTSVFVLLIPLMLLLLPRKNVSIGDLSYAPQSGFSQGGYSAQKVPKTGNPFLTPQKDAADASAGTAPGSGGFPVQRKDDDMQNAQSTQNAASEITLPGLDSAHKTIRISDEDFLQWVDALYKHPHQFEGYRISVKGMTFHDSRFMSKTEFIPARLLMVCCAADLVPYGLVCRYDKISELENGAWLTVTGTLAVRDYRGSPEPQIDVEKLEPAEAADAYLYPGI